MNELIQQKLQELAILKINKEAEDESIGNMLFELEACKPNEIRSGIAGEIRRLAQRRGFKMVGRVGDLVPYDHKIHRCAYPVKQGDMVRVASAGLVQSAKVADRTWTYSMVRTDLDSPDWASVDAERAEEKRKAEAAEAEKWEKARADEASR